MWSDWLVFCDWGFRLSALWCFLSVPTILCGFLLPWTWGISSRLLQQNAATAPYLEREYILSAAIPDLGREVSPLCHSPLLQAAISIIYRHICLCIYVYNRHILIDTNILYLFFIFYIIFYIFVSILYFVSFNRYRYFVLTQWCLTLSDHMDCSHPGSTVHRISQARILEWVAISFSKGSSRPKIEPTSLVSPA